MRIIKNILALITITILVGIVMPPFMVVGLISESILEGVNYLMVNAKHTAKRISQYVITN